MASSWRRIALILLLPVPGCKPEHPPAEPSITPTWRLSSLPAIDIGVAQGDERQELSGASSSYRLADGRIVIANSGSYELRFFDREGRFLEVSGRHGSGPGEFTGSMQIIPRGADRFGVYDAPQLSVFDTAGKFVGAETIQTGGLENFPLTVWLYRRNWIDGPADTLARPQVAAVLDQLSDVPSGAYRFVKIADDGRLWTQVRTSLPSDSMTPWNVYDREARPLASIPIPGDLEIHQIGSDFLLARRWTDNDIEHIQLYHIEGITDGSPSTKEHPRTAANDSVAVAPGVEGELAISVRNLVTAQEMHYAEAGGYAERASDLNWTSPPETHVHLMRADKRGWVGMLAHDGWPIMCGMAVGGSTPAGWGEGSPKCSRPRSTRQ